MLNLKRFLWVGMVIFFVCFPGGLLAQENDGVQDDKLQK